MNTNRFRSGAPRAPQAQRGAALVVVLILLLVTTLLGLASLRGTLLEERMSANLYDRGLAFQAAEAALREGEALVTGIDPLSLFPSRGSNGGGSTCTNGFCTSPTTAQAADPRWLLDSPPWRNGAAVANGTAGGSITPQFFIEYMGKGAGWAGCEKLRPRNPQCMKSRFRVTSQGGDPSTGRAAVLLQTTFATP